ncbi:hypothetical protein LS74_001610 [Helicobacter magdeburgensis]|uniref:Uncharacterized protein n=1 Tax=Helicobacter magdeburgensis TaxID=471858 RepID=A0A4U8T209_9HELI|nr:hypothetical protein [Helicobacter magdeburgensis]TLD93451.1 hypothetical protein LS74_001610 [Helicobacter magdeburgensis]
MKLTVKLVEELNSCYGSDLISFSVEKGATLFYKGLLKSFIEKHSISDSEGFQKASPCFLEEMREACDVIVGWNEKKANKIWWEYDNHGIFLKTCHAYEPLYVFYFGDHFVDPVSILREEGKVSFEIFIDNIAAWEREWEAELEQMEDSDE